MLQSAVLLAFTLFGASTTIIHKKKSNRTFLRITIFTHYTQFVTNKRHIGFGITVTLELFFPFNLCWKCWMNGTKFEKCAHTKNDSVEFRS